MKALLIDEVPVREVKTNVYRYKNKRRHETLKFLEELHEVFNWGLYERDTLGNKNRLKKYVVLLQKWIKGESLKQIIDDDIDFRRRKKRMVYITGKDPKPFDGSPEHVNQVIAENLNMINDVLLFRLSNYFLRFSGEYRAYKDPLNTGYTFPDGYEFVEYGTWDRFQIKLQKNSFTREVASYIARNLDTYTVMVGKQRLLKRSLFNCPNASARRESFDISLNMPELFENE